MVPTPSLVADEVQTPETDAAPSSSPARRFRRLLWAELLVRVFGPTADPLSCDKCGGRMRVLSSIHKADVTEKILACLGLPSVPPQAQPARGPPDTEMFEFTWSAAEWGC